jgi:hypothetical protein
MIGSFPSSANGTAVSGGAATSWTVRFDGNTSGTVYVICAS